jgi:hypothetical protein
VLALAGVAASLVLQAGESKANREQASRVIHTDLLKMAMDDLVGERERGEVLPEVPPRSWAASVGFTRRPPL